MKSSDIGCSSLMIATPPPSFDAKIMSNGIRALCIHIVTVEVEDHPPARSQRGPLHRPPLLLRSRIRQLQLKPMRSSPRHNLNVICANRLRERPERRDNYRQRKSRAPSTLLLTKALSLS